MKLKEIKPGMVIHCKTHEQTMVLADNRIIYNDPYKTNGILWIITEFGRNDWMLDDKRGYEFIKEEYPNYKIVEFSDLIIPEEEMSAVEVTKIIGDICRKYTNCYGCPFKEYNTNDEGCTSWRGRNADIAIEICRKWKADHEKKNPEVEWVWAVYQNGKDYYIETFTTEDEAKEVCEKYAKMFEDCYLYYRQICRVKGAANE